MNLTRVSPCVFRRFHRSKPSGLTRLEVLLVLSVISLNLILFLPFVERARESARKNQCRDHLKQLGLATHLYYEAFNRFPAGFDLSPNGEYQGWGWNLKILPYMDAAHVYNAIEPHLAKGFQGIPAADDLKLRMASLVCPSDNAVQAVPHALVNTSRVVDGMVSLERVDRQNRLPRTSYFGNAGYLQLDAGGIQYNSAGVPTSLRPLTNAGSLGHFGKSGPSDRRYCDQAAFGGVFGQNSQVEIMQIKDGTSNTILLGERYAPADSDDTDVGYGTWIGVPDCTSSQGLAMALADTSLRINIGLPHREQVTGFGSLHPGGVHFAFCDGRIRFVSQKIDIELLRSLSVINDCER